MDPTEINVDVSVTSYSMAASAESYDVPVSVAAFPSLDVSAATFDVPVS